jgi:hypothetical protein
LAVATSSPGQRRLEVLTHEACIERLQRSTVGRMAVIWRGEPHIVPVNYRWVGDAVIVRTDANTPLGNAAGQVAVLEIDSVDDQSRTGWSVVVRGRCSALDDWDAPSPSAEGEPSEGEASQSRPWPPGAKVRRLRIEAESVTGRLVSVVEMLGTEWWRQSPTS